MYELSNDLRVVLACVYDVLRGSVKWPTYRYLEKLLDRDFHLDIEDIQAKMPLRLTTLPPGSYPASDPWEVKLTVGGLSYVNTPAAGQDLALFFRIFRRMAKEERELAFTIDQQPEPCLTTGGLSAEWSIHPNDLQRVFLVIAAEPEPWVGNFAPIGDGSNLRICASKVLKKFRTAQTIDDYLTIRHAFFNPPAPGPGAPTFRPPELAVAANQIQKATPLNTPETASVGKAPEKWDVFICHASADKASFVAELAQSLREKGVKVWYDEFTLTVGDSLLQKIDEGLAQSRFGVVVLSPNFFSRPWPRSELDGLASRQFSEERKVILPVWHNISIEAVREKSPILASLLAASSADGISQVVDDLLKAMDFTPPLSTGNVITVTIPPNLT